MFITTFISTVLTIAYVLINLLCLSRFLDDYISESQFLFFFISSTFVTWLCIHLNEERRDV